ncbi:MAG: hypothetical protein ABR920_18180, partial [Terriglobales bacterium]
GSTYFGLGRSADARPGSELGYAQCFQCGECCQTANLDANDKIEDFHATDLLKTHDHQQMLKDLAGTIALQKKIHPVSFGIVVADFNSFSLTQRRFLTGATLSKAKLVTSGCPNKAYFVPFQLCLKSVTEYAPVGGRADFFFGLDRPFAGYAKELFKQMKSQSREDSDWKTKDRLGKPSFPLASQTPQLQAADLLVHLTYQHMLERHKAQNWKVQPSGLLRQCLRNLRSREDHAFQNKECLGQTLELLRKAAGVEWMDELGQPPSD